MSNAFAALIWWVIPITGLLGGIGYVVWITKFKKKYEAETNRSVSQFEEFQKLDVSKFHLQIEKVKANSECVFTTSPN